MKYIIKHKDFIILSRGSRCFQSELLARFFRQKIKNLGIDIKGWIIVESKEVINHDKI